MINVLKDQCLSPATAFPALLHPILEVPGQ